MTEAKELPLTPTLKSALQAVARMKSDSAIAWREVLVEPEEDNRHAPSPEPQQGWNPAGR